MRVLQSFFANARRRRPRRIVVDALMICLAACTNDLHTAPGRPRAVTVESGDRQIGLATAPLRLPLVIRVLDTDSNPVENATVRWTTPDRGTFSPSASETDQRGFARTFWTLGAAAGDQRAHATVDGLDGPDFVAVASTDGGPMAVPAALVLTTPDGSGQTVHPDYVAMPSGWPAAGQYLLATPYPNGNAGFENPSIYTGSTAVSWAAPAGVSNPVATPQRGYLSDPDAVAVPESNELWVYYRQVEAKNEIYLIRSKDGVTFTPPRLVASADNHEIVSPSVVRRGPTDWLMWAVNAGAGCAASTTTIELRRSTNGIDWSSPVKTSFNQGGGISPWHIDVQWIPSRNEFWAIYNGKTAGSCTTPALFIATSPDGVQWTTYASPILARGASPELADVVYRSTFAYDATTDMIDFWYSGAKFDHGQYVWRSAYQRRTRSEVFATAAKKSSAALAALVPRVGLPDLVDPP